MRVGIGQQLRNVFDGFIGRFRRTKLPLSDVSFERCA
jgi:hypothetical protein